MAAIRPPSCFNAAAADATWGHGGYGAGYVVGGYGHPWLAAHQKRWIEFQKALASLHKGEQMGMALASDVAHGSASTSACVHGCWRRWALPRLSPPDVGL